MITKEQIDEIKKKLKEHGECRGIGNKRNPNCHYDEIWTCMVRFDLERELEILEERQKAQNKILDEVKELFRMFCKFNLKKTILEGDYRVLNNKDYDTFVSNLEELRNRKDKPQ
jgi:hypothetical protein